MRDDELMGFLRGLGRSLSGGDAAGVAACWAIPALVLGDAGAVVVTERAQAERYFAAAVDGYRARGIDATEPEILRIDRLSERLTAVDVRWPYFDAEHRRVGDETSGYVIWADDEGALRIRVAFSRGQERRTGQSK